MRRGLIDDLASPVPVMQQLPAIYQELDPNMVRLTESFDAVMAPIWLVLDNLDAYVDPAIAPHDFVAMLAGWIGLEIDRNWRDDQLRHLVAHAVELYRWRGTVQGVIALVEAYTGVTPDVSDSGGTTWSALPDGPIPGTGVPSVHVGVHLPAGASEDLARLTRLIAENVPAHVAVNVEIVRSESS